MLHCLTISHYSPLFLFRFQQRWLHMQVRPGEDPEQIDTERADRGRGDDGLWESNRWGWPGQWRTVVARGLPAHDCSSARFPQVGKRREKWDFVLREEKKSLMEHLFYIVTLICYFKNKLMKSISDSIHSTFHIRIWRAQATFVNTGNSSIEVQEAST